jgi:hypothetical protein
MCNEAD